MLRGLSFWILLNKLLRQNSNCVQIDAVLPFTRHLKPHSFQNASLLTAFSNRFGFGDGLDRPRVNGRRNHIKSDAVTNELNKRLNFRVSLHGQHGTIVQLETNLSFVKKLADSASATNKSQITRGLLSSLSRHY